MTEPNGVKVSDLLRILSDPEYADYDVEFVIALREDSRCILLDRVYSVGSEPVAWTLKKVFEWNTRALHWAKRKVEASRAGEKP